MIKNLIARAVTVILCIAFQTGFTVVLIWVDTLASWVTFFCIFLWFASFIALYFLVLWAFIETDFTRLDR